MGKHITKIAILQHTSRLRKALLNLLNNVSAIAKVFILSRDCQEMINMIVLWITTIGKASTLMLKTTLFLNVQRAPTQMNNITLLNPCFTRSNTSTNNDSILLGDFNHPRLVRKMVHKKEAKGHWKWMCYVVSN
jgi:hypothetical protein